MSSSTQSNLFYETVEDALADVVAALGGAKAVGAMMWPDKPMREAHNLLLACLNTERRERFNPDQVVFLMRRGREANCHAAMRWLAAECGYAEPVPIDPEEKQAKLQREFIAAVRYQAELAAKLGVDHRLPEILRAVK